MKIRFLVSLFRRLSNYAFVLFLAASFSGTVSCGHIPAPDMSQFANMPMPTEEELQAASAFLEDFFSNMSDDEMNDFMQFYEGFVKDVESGKINLEDIFGPMTPPPPQKPAQKKKPDVKPLPEIRKEEPKKALRDKNAAATMIKNIIDSIANIRLKAASSHKVDGTLEPLDADIDSLVFFLHAVLKKEHFEQLVTDKDFLDLHDTLAALRKTLVEQEPYLQVREFGLGTEDPKQKARSKRALESIVNALQNAFTKKHVLADFEKLFKKYEPALLKQKKEAEQAEARAKKDLAKMERWRSQKHTIAPEIKHRTYPTRYDSRGFRDDFRRYQAPGPSRQATAQRRASTQELPPAPKPSFPGKTSAPKKGVTKGTKKTEDKKEESPTQVADPAAIIIVSKLRDDLAPELKAAEESALKIEKLAKGSLPVYLTTGITYERDELPQTIAKNIRNQFFESRVHLAQADKIRTTIKKKIKDLPKDQRGTYKKYLANNFRQRTPLHRVYKTTLDVLAKEIGTPGTMQNDFLPWFASKNPENLGIISEWQMAYEKLYTPSEMVTRKNLSKTLNERSKKET